MKTPPSRTPRRRTLHASRYTSHTLHTLQARYPNIVATYGLCMTEGNEDRFSRVPRSLALVMELMPHR